VGNIFKLGTKYSESMNAKFMNEQGKEEPIIMGCYGLGVSRTLMAVVEQHTYENGLVWPKELRPYTYHILVADVTNDSQMQAAETLYKSLSKQSSVLLDDRNERLGSKFQDADLIGSPIVIVVGKKITDNALEVHHRLTKQVSEENVNDFLSTLN
jgi:prolyl-tRNA synthetase